MEKQVSIVVFGDLCRERVSWDKLAARLNIQVILTPTLDKLNSLANKLKVDGALVEIPQLCQVRVLLREARMIVCHPISAPPDPEELEKIGAFHSVPRPLNANEVMRSLAFVQQAQQRRGKIIEFAA